MARNAPSVLDGVNRLTQLAGCNRLELLLFSLEDAQRFGINVFKVREVIRAPTLTRVPHAGPGVLGLAAIREDTVPVLDLSALIGGRPLGTDGERFVIVAEYSRRTVGFLVREVSGIVNRNWEEIRHPPAALGDTGYLTALTTLAGPAGDELIEILDVEQVLADLFGVDDDLLYESLPELGTEAAGRTEILIADDSALARRQLIRTLEALGVRYRVAVDGRAALATLTAMDRAGEGPLSARLAMVISDIEMPEMDGYALTAAIRRDPRLTDIYVCLHTSLSGAFNAAMAERVGADVLLPKFDPRRLAELVAARVERAAAPAVA